MFKIEITENYIKCEECGKHFKKLTHNHLFCLHGLTITEYKDRYDLCLSQPLEALYIKKLRQEYNKRDNATKNIKNNPNSVPLKKGVNTWDGRKIPEQKKAIARENGKKMVKHTEEAKRKISESNYIKWQNPVYAAKFKSQEKHRTVEFRKMMSERSKKYWLSKKSVC